MGHSETADEATVRRSVDLTEEQIALLWERFPYDRVLVEMMCRDALRWLSVPNRTGRWPRYDARVYYDDGWHGSGYLLVHWDDSHKVPNCLSNGYCTDPNFRAEEMVWDDQPERERLLGIRQTLDEWAW